MTDESPSRGAALREPVKIDRNVFISVKNGIIEAISSRRPARGARQIDIDSGLLTPPLVNAHTHLQLSWLKDSLTFGEGFAAWLKSLVPLLLKTTEFEATDALRDAVWALKSSGAALVGDIGGSIPGALSETARAVADAGLTARFFCEKFGWKDGSDIWPSRSKNEIDRANNATPCGHALYSTAPASLLAIHEWCLARGLPFSIHLAESEEEDLMLLEGKGALYEYYKDTVLPENWSPPRMTPTEYAQSLGLLKPRTLAVHGARLSTRDLRALETSGTAVCLCPRSNARIGVGDAPFADLLASDILLCLGTDGLTSCPDLDVRSDMRYLREKHDFPASALLRMATVNGASALGFDFRDFAPRIGGRAAFALIKDME